MFNKLKHLKDMRSQAKTMRNSLADEIVTVEKSGIKVEMNGNMEIINITLNNNISNDSLEGMLADCINEAIKKTQRLMAQKFQEMGGMQGLTQ